MRLSRIAKWTFRGLARFSAGLTGVAAEAATESRNILSNLRDLNNLASDPRHRATLNRLRRVPHDRLVEIDDAYIEPAKLREPVEYWRNCLSA